MVDYFVKEDFEGMYGVSYQTVKDKMTLLLNELRGMGGFDKFAVSSKTKGRAERGLWGILYESGKFTDPRNVPHFTLDMDEGGITLSLGVMGRIAPKKLAKGILSGSKDKFIYDVFLLEREKKAKFSILYEWVRNYGQAACEWGFTDKIDLYCNFYCKNGVPYKGMEKQHQDTRDKRRKKLLTILEELSLEDGYTYFRIVLNVPKSSLLTETSLRGQAQLVHNDAKELLSFYESWKVIVS